MNLPQTANPVQKRRESGKFKKAAAAVELVQLLRQLLLCRGLRPHLRELELFQFRMRLDEGTDALFQDGDTASRSYIPAFDGTGL